MWCQLAFCVVDKSSSCGRQYLNVSSCYSLQHGVFVIASCDCVCACDSVSFLNSVCDGSTHLKTAQRLILDPPSVGQVCETRVRS